MNTDPKNLFRSLTATGLVLAALLPAGLANAQKPTAATPKSGKASAHAAASTAPPSASCVTLKLRGLECPSCAHQVQQSLMGVAGVQSADVSVPKQTAVVRLSAGNPPSSEALTAAVKKVGFGVAGIEKSKSTGGRKAGKPRA